jgi:hypothetical protein
MTLHDLQRETALDKRAATTPASRQAREPGAAPSSPWSAASWPPCSTTASDCPQDAVAALFGVRPETVIKRIGDIRQLPDQAGTSSSPARTASPASTTFAGSQD